MNKAEFERGLLDRTRDVFQKNPSLRNHLSEHPWLTNSLGDPFSGIWFLAERPSLGQVERARDPGGKPPTEQAQWYASKADKLFRQALVDSGFKEGGIDSPDGWRCYITNVIKDAEYAEKSNRGGIDNLKDLAEIWSPVLRWQLEATKPKLLVVMGTKVSDLVNHLSARSKVMLPQAAKVLHYSYVAFRPDQNRRGPMHPERVAAYIQSFKAVRERMNRL